MISNVAGQNSVTDYLSCCFCVINKRQKLYILSLITFKLILMICWCVRLLSSLRSRPHRRAPSLPLAKFRGDQVRERSVKNDTVNASLTPRRLCSPTCKRQQHFLRSTCCLARNDTKREADWSKSHTHTQGQDLDVWSHLCFRWCLY